MIEMLYRAQETWWSGDWLDEHGNSHPGEPKLTIGTDEYKVVKRTAKGAWISYCGTSKFVRSDSRKRFAYPTQEEAMRSLIARKHRQVKILRAQLQRAEKAHAGAKALLEKGRYNSDGYMY